MAKNMKGNEEKRSTMGLIEELNKDLPIDEKIDLFEINLDLAKFKKSMINANLDQKTLRFLVDTFYQIQDLRIARANQLRAISQNKDGDGFDASLFIMSSIESIEASIKKIIDVYTDKNPVCYWAKQTTGVGPLISASFYSMLDITKATSAGGFLSYCGLNDNNTPWLGAEKAKEITTKVNDDYKEYLSVVLKDINHCLKSDKQKKDMRAKITDLIDTKYDQLNKGQDNEQPVLVTEYDLSELLSIDVFASLRSKHDMSELLEGLAVWYNPKFAVSGMIDRLAIQDKVNRKPSSIRTGGTNHSTKKFVDVDAIIKFLSKPPYSRRLKNCAYKLGESFVFNHTRGKHNVYGRLYMDRKAYEMAKNENLEYKDQAERILSEKNFSSDTKSKEFYKKGMLPPGHIEMRARRFVEKIFISHFYEMWHLVEYGKPAPIPYILAYPDPNRKDDAETQHIDYIPPQVDFAEILRKFNLPVPENIYPEGFDVREFEWEKYEEELKKIKIAKKAARAKK